MKVKNQKCVFIGNLTPEELEIIEDLQRETATGTMTKAIRKGLLCYQRMKEEYKTIIEDNIKLQKEIKRCRQQLDLINEIINSEQIKTLNHEQKTIHQGIRKKSWRN